MKRPTASSVLTTLKHAVRFKGIYDPSMSLPDIVGHVVASAERQLRFRTGTRVPLVLSRGEFTHAHLALRTRAYPCVVFPVSCRAGRAVCRPSTNASVHPGLA